MKILVIRFSSIGDIVLCTPVFRWIKSNLPESEVHFLTKSKFKHVVNGNPNLDRVFEWENEEDRAELFKLEYDLIVDLHNNLRSRIVKLRFWGVPTRVLNKENFFKALIVGRTQSRLLNFATRLPWVQKKFNGFAVENIVVRNLGLVKDLNERSEDCEISQSDLELNFYVEEPHQPTELPQKFAALVLGGTYATKQMPLELLLEIVHKLKGNIVLLGGPSEVSLADQLEEKIQLANSNSFLNIINYCGKLNLNDSAWVASKSSVVVSGDTGMAHIAAALGCNLIMIWGNTVPDFGMVPPIKDEANAHHFNVLDLSCRPCSKLGFKACPNKHFRCMMDQDSQSIRTAMEKYL